KKALELRKSYSADLLLVEDAGSGVSLIQTLKQQHCSVRACKLEGDKTTRMSTGSIVIEGGQLLFPANRTPGIDDYLSELLSFPYGKHDDQVDSTSQFCHWLIERQHPTGCPATIGQLRWY